jgi:DNA-binding transcriptional regulator YiaG
VGKVQRKAQRKRAAKRHRVGRGRGAVLVRRIRKRLRLSQAAFAKLLGVAQMTICRWEQGTAPVRGPAVQAVQFWAQRGPGSVAVTRLRKGGGKP